MSDLAWMRPKLAELCGWLTLPEDPHWYSEPPDREGFHNNIVGVDEWRPDEDVAQAVRCLEAWRDQTMGDWIIESKPVAGEMAYWVELAPFAETPNPKRLLLDGPLPRAICLAIAAALGWEKPGTEGAG